MRYVTVSKVLPYMYVHDLEFVIVKICISKLLIPAEDKFQNTAVLNGFIILISLGRNHWSPEHRTGTSKEN